jgi:hypothetical protein
MVDRRRAGISDCLRDQSRSVTEGITWPRIHMCRDGVDERYADLVIGKRNQQIAAGRWIQRVNINFTLS